MKQLSLFPKSKTEFGGVPTQGRRKTARPIDSRRPIFLTLKATGAEHFLANKPAIIEIFARQSARVGARIYSLAIQADHLHLAVQFGSRLLYRRWIRAITGILARKVPGVRWLHRPHTEVVSWGRHMTNVLDYIELNRQEAGLIEWSHLYVEEFIINKWSKIKLGSLALAENTIEKDNGTPPLVIGVR